MNLVEKIMGKLPGTASFMPAPNKPGVPMVLFSECHNKVSGCVNPLVETAAWVRALTDWAGRSGLSERIRARVPGDTIYRHNKLQFSVSGYPNGCSRPQIADFGVTGFFRPGFDAGSCTACEECERACPDKAIVVSADGLKWDRALCQGCRQCRNACPANAMYEKESGVRLMVGGKLGRHPHLAEPAGEFHTPGDLIRKVDGFIDNYLSCAIPGERFAAFIQRLSEEKKP